MTRTRAPYGNGYYTIEHMNGKYIATIYDDAFDTDGTCIVSDNYSDLCEKIADVYF